MVYCGKPSRGCSMCRTRRIKCDETRPTCKQCAKSRRQCPGYKDEWNLVFRNETQAIHRRFTKASKKQPLAHARDKPSASSLVPGPAKLSSLVPSMSQLTHLSLSLPRAEQAACHFMANFVLVPRHGSTHGFLEYVVPLLKVQNVSEHFKLAFDACAVGSLWARYPDGASLQEQALGNYTKALQSTYRAICDPDTAGSDATLATVLLLGLFENITAKHVGTLAWGSHIEGALELVRRRGRKQLRSKLGLLLFVAVRTQMIIHTLTTGTAPMMGVEWWFNDAVLDKHAAECQRLNIRTGQLRAEVNRLMTTTPRCPETIEVMLEMMRKCQTVDQACVSWAKGLPTDLQFKTVAWEDHVLQGDYSKAEVYPGRVDAYPDLWACSIWSMQRCSRIILASIIVRCAAWVCSPVDYRTTPEYATAARTCIDTITDIIASVPYQLGWFNNRKHLLEPFHLSAFGCGDEDVPKGLPGYFLTWPLSCVHGQDYASDSQRAWVRGRLEYIGNRLGVRYADLLAQINVRVPSMLIRRDGLMASPYPAAANFEKLLSYKHSAPPQLGHTPHPLRQREATCKEDREKNLHELLRKVRGRSGKVDDWTTKSYLHVLDPLPAATTAAMRDI